MSESGVGLSVFKFHINSTYLPVTEKETIQPIETMLALREQNPIHPTALFSSHRPILPECRYILQQVSIHLNFKLPSPYSCNHVPSL